MITQSITPKILAKVLVLILVLWLGWQWSTHYVNWSPYRLSEYIAKNNLKAEECNKLVVFNPPGPLPDEQIRTCIYLVAELTKDPSACELLMPSSYGLSCVGGARGNYECNFYEDNEVSWVESNAGKKATFKECVKPDPQRSQHGDECCTVALVTRLKTNNDCTSLSSNQMMFDECQYRLSFKNHDPSSCELIQNPRIKSACVVSAKALQKDPSVCSGCTQPVESVEELVK